MAANRAYLASLTGQGDGDEADATKVAAQLPADHALVLKAARRLAAAAIRLEAQTQVGLRAARPMRLLVPASADRPSASCGCLYRSSACTLAAAILGWLPAACMTAGVGCDLPHVWCTPCRRGVTDAPQATRLQPRCMQAEKAEHMWARNERRRELIQAQMAATLRALDAERLADQASLRAARHALTVLPELAEEEDAPHGLLPG